MLVLSRQRDESTLIGDDVEVTVVDIRGDKVRTGIKAPEQYQVYRKELYVQILQDIARGNQPPPVRERKGGGNLVLSRQRDESIVLVEPAELQKFADAVAAGRGEGYKVPTACEYTVVDIRGDKVRLGFVAPADVPVHRKEVYEAIRRENRQAAPSPFAPSLAC